MKMMPKKLWIEDEAGNKIAYVPEAQYQAAENALAELTKAASEVSGLGAKTGPQWTRLSASMLRARLVLPHDRRHG